MPSNEQQWQNIASEFESKWNFPHCLASMDGKHVILQCPINSGSDYYNYKSFFSIVLFALVDANYKFLFVDVGCQGRISDGGVFKHCVLHKLIEEKKLAIPASSPLPGRCYNTPYVIVADEAFPLKENIMKPFSGIHKKGTKERIFNYRLSRARRVVENVFGICSSIFRILRKPILLEPDKAKVVVLTVTYLHNFLRASSSSQQYFPPGTLDQETDGNFNPGSWRTTITSTNQETASFLPLSNVPRRPTEISQKIRLEFSEYFATNGSVPWQQHYA